MLSALCRRVYLQQDKMTPKKTVHLTACSLTLLMSYSQLLVLIMVCHSRDQKITQPLSRYLAQLGYTAIFCSKIAVNFDSRLRAVPLQSVESKLGRTGEGEMAERETGERRERGLLPSFHSASYFLPFRSLCSISSLA